MFQVIDNFLSKGEFESICDLFETQGIMEFFPWFLTPYIANLNDKSDIHFNHGFIQDEKLNSPFWPKLEPIYKQLNAKTFLRAKANLYLGSNKLIEHPPHSDYLFPHKGAIFYVNNNDGFTRLRDGTKIESIANRLLLFNPAEPHNSTNCTNSRYRININFNFL